MSYDLFLQFQQYLIHQRDINVNYLFEESAYPEGQESTLKE